MEIYIAVNFKVEREGRIVLRFSSINFEAIWIRASYDEMGGIGWSSVAFLCEIVQIEFELKWAGAEKLWSLFPI